MKTLTRTVRLAIGVAAMLAIMAPVAQARPLDSHGAITASQRATDLIMPQTAAPAHGPVSASARATDLIMPQAAPAIIVAHGGSTASARATDQLMPLGSGTDIVQGIPVQTTDRGFDWVAGAAGAATVLGIMLLAVAVAGHGRRRVAVSG
jgi:hypothetical protein